MLFDVVSIFKPNVLDIDQNDVRRARDVKSTAYATWLCPLHPIIQTAKCKL